MKNIFTSLIGFILAFESFGNNPDSLKNDFPISENDTIVELTENEKFWLNEQRKAKLLIPKVEEDLSFLSKYSANLPANGKAKQTVKTMLSRQAVYHSISYNKDNDLIGFARRDQVLEIRDMNTAQTYCINTEKTIDKVKFSDNGKYLAGMTLWDNTVIKMALNDFAIFKTDEKKWLWQLSEKIKLTDSLGKLKTCVFSPSGERVAVIFEERLYIMDCDSGYVVHQLDPKPLNKFKFPSKYYFIEDFLDLSFKDENKVEISTGSIFVNYNVVKKILGRVIPFIKSSTTYTNGITRVEYDFTLDKSLSTNMIKGFVIPSYVMNNTFMRGKYIFSYFANNNVLGVSSDIKSVPVFIQFPGTLSDLELDTTTQIMYYALQYNSKIFRYDLKNNTELKPLEDHIAPVSDVELAFNKNWIISADVNGLKNFWSKEGELLFRMYSDEKGEYMLSTDQNYYQSTKGVLKDVRFMKGNDVFRFESFDLNFNRPDILVKKIGTKDVNLVATYENAVKMRAEKFGINLQADPNDLQLPIINITNKKDMLLSTTSQQLILDVEAVDEKHPLKEMIVFVNGAESQRILISKKPNKHNQKITVKLTSGVNFIEVTCLNENGNESLRQSHEIVCTATIPQKVYYFGMGVSNYKDSDFSLKYAAKDVRDIVKQLKAEHGKNLVVDTLMDKNVTLENIKKSVAKLSKATENDLIIVSLNGHGLLDQNYSFYFGTYDVDFLKPELRGLPYSEIEKMMAGVKSRNKLVLIDACHSGEMDKSEISDKLVASTVKAKEVSFRGAEKLSKFSKRDGVSTFQIMRDQFSDLSYQSGTHIISASGGFEYAMESDKWNNGVFTYSFLTGLSEKKADENSDGIVTISELQNYVYQNVMSLTNGKQLPTSRRSNVRNDFGLNKK